MSVPSQLVELNSTQTQSFLCDEPMEFVSTQKGGKMLTYCGYLYRKGRSRTTVSNEIKTYWVCEWSTEKQGDGPHKCPGKAHTVRREENEYLVSLPVEHNHAPVAHRTHMALARETLKVRGRITNEDPTKVVQIVNSCADASVKPYLPSNSAMRQIVKRARKQEMPREPVNLNDIDVPQEFRFIGGEQFLAADSQFGENRVLLFATPTNVQHLSKAKYWVMDGTFKTVPVLFRQLYSIHAPVGYEGNFRVMPLVYCLMTSKSEECYTKMFRDLNNFALDVCGVDLNPKFIVSDYEKAAINAYSGIYRDVQSKGCLFHLGQSIWRRIQSAGLARQYGEDEDFSLKMRLFVSLAFLKAEEIPGAFNDILRGIIPETATDIIEWFDEVYVRGRVRNIRPDGSVIRTPPLFPPSMWNVEDSMREGVPRTQNSVESWHRRWETLIGKPHVGVYRMIREICLEQEQTITAIQKIVAGIPVIPPKKKYIEKEKRIKTIMASRGGPNPRSIADFLRGIAYNMTL